VKWKKDYRARLYSKWLNPVKIQSEIEMHKQLIDEKNTLIKRENRICFSDTFLPYDLLQAMYLVVHLLITFKSLMEK
jgi:hypothetical protein